jgi:hypothetical protein
METLALYVDVRPEKVTVTESITLGGTKDKSIKNWTSESNVLSRNAIVTV